MVIKTMPAVTLCAEATVEGSALLNLSQLVSGIIQACSGLISLDCVRMKLCPAIWTISTKGSGGLAICVRERCTLGSCAKEAPAVCAHHTTQPLPARRAPRMPCTWICLQLLCSSPLGKLPTSVSNLEKLPK